MGNCSRKKNKKMKKDMLVFDANNNFGKTTHGLLVLCTK